MYKHKYDLVLNPDDEFTSKDLVGDVLVRDAGPLFIDRLLRLMEVKKLKKLKSLTMLVEKEKVHHPALQRPVQDCQSRRRAWW